MVEVQNVFRGRLNFRNGLLRVSLWLFERPLGVLGHRAARHGHSGRRSDRRDRIPPVLLRRVRLPRLVNGRGCNEILCQCVEDIDI